MFLKREKLLFVAVVFLASVLDSRWTLSQEVCESHGHCAHRDTSLALSLGRRCRRACNPDPSLTPCRRGLQCRNAHECGFSCINMTKECSDPPIIPNMRRVVVYRRNQAGCHSQRVNSRFLFDDVAIYECQPGFSLLYPSAKHYCTGRAAWSHPGHSVCIRSQCCLPPLTPHMQSSIRDRSVAFGTSVTFKCDRGYEMSGNEHRKETARTITCLRNGKFSKAIPECTRRSACKSTSCMNGGVCVESGSGFYCLCPRHTHGARCEIVENYCMLSPCQNGGTCRKTRSSYTCACRLGYGGRNCEQRVCTSLTRIPVGVVVYGQTEEGVYLQGTMLPVGCVEPDQLLVTTKRSITCLGGGSWSPSYELLRCV